MFAPAAGKNDVAMCKVTHFAGVPAQPRRARSGAEVARQNAPCGAGARAKKPAGLAVQERSAARKSKPDRLEE